MARSVITVLLLMAATPAVGAEVAYSCAGSAKTITYLRDGNYNISISDDRLLVSVEEAAQKLKVGWGLPCLSAQCLDYVPTLTLGDDMRAQFGMTDKYKHYVSINFSRASTSMEVSSMVLGESSDVWSKVVTLGSYACSVTTPRVLEAEWWLSEVRLLVDGAEAELDSKAGG